MSEREPKTGRFPPRPESPKGGQLYANESGGEARGQDRLILGGRTQASISSKAERVAQHLANLDAIAFDPEEAGSVRVNASAAALKHLAPDANALLKAGRGAEELTDDELADIARRGSGDPAEPAGDPSVTH